MIGENGTPATPDWTPCVGNRCTCGSSENHCRCLRVLCDEACCNSCGHQVVVGPSVPYYGD